MLTPYSPRKEYNDNMPRSNIFLGSMNNLNSRITPVDKTPISMLKSLNVINEDSQFDPFRETTYKKPSKRTKSKNKIKTVLKKVLARTMGEVDDDEDTSDRSNQSQDETMIEGTSSPNKPVIRYTEPPPHLRYNNPYGYVNPLYSPGNNYGPPRNFQPPMYPQPMPTNLANNGRKFIQPQQMPNNYPPNMMQPKNGFGPNPYGPYGPMRGYGPGMPNGGYMPQPISNSLIVDPMKKVKQAIEEQKRKEAEEDEEYERKKRAEAEKKRQQEKKQKILADRKTNAKRRLRSFTWSIAYPHLLKAMVKHMVMLVKKKTMIEVPKKLNNSFEVSQLQLIYLLSFTRNTS
jgi:hypothetical protein